MICLYPSELSEVKNWTDIVSGEITEVIDEYGKVIYRNERSQHTKFNKDRTNQIRRKSF